MQTVKTAITALIICVSVSSGSLADTDYRCLNQCVNAGKRAQQCLSDCSYAPTDGTHHPELSPEENHNPFAAPQPVHGDVTLPRMAPKKSHETMDYGCLRDCRHDGMQEPLCRKRCVKPEPGAPVPSR